MHLNLFTTCTSSGNIPPVPELDGKKLRQFKTHDEFRDYWEKTVKEHDSERVEAAYLYTGFSFQSAQKIANKMKQAGHTVDFYIMSIGFGLIHPEEHIVPYNLSLLVDDSPTSASMHRIVKGEKFNVEYWWEAINLSQRGVGDPIAKVLAKKGKDTHNLFCISGSFFRMVAEDIYKGIQQAPDASVTILGPSNTQQFVKAPRRLDKLGKIVPIDRDKLLRLVPGNKFDQPQRAGIYLVDQFLAKGDWDPQKLLEPISYISGGKALEQVDIAQKVAEGKASKKPKDEVHRELLEAGCVISSHAFEMLWDPSKQETLVKSNDSDAAVNALKHIGFSQPEKEEESVDLLVIFVDAMKKGGHTGAMFGSKDVVAWAKSYCESTSRDLPPKFLSPNKLSHFLRTVGPSFGVYPAHNPKAQIACFQIVK